MKKTYSFFLAFFLTVIAHGQNYIQFPTQNAQWNCTYYQGWWNATNDHGSNTDIITYITNGDSIINNITYTKIFANSTTVLYWVYPDTIFYNSSTGPGYDYIGAMRNDSINKILYFLERDSINEKVAYNFNLNPGDTIPDDWYNYRYQSPVGLITVDHIDSILINGSYRRQIHIAGGSSLIEGIGSADGLFNPLNWCVECGASLDCHSVNSQAIYPFGGSCQMVDITEHEKLSLKVYPNPSHDIFKIDGLKSDARFEIYNSVGQQIFNKYILDTETIDLSGYPIGIYFCIGQTNDRSFKTVLIKN